MPSRPPRPCAQPGCPKLSDSGRCPEHARKPWTRARPRRMPGGNGWAWQRTRARIAERDGYRCVYCGGPFEVIDHVIPISQGGSDADSNLRASCKACNERKRREEARRGRGVENLEPFGPGNRWPTNARAVAKNMRGA
jgi:5-methylcytosine-specific restriction enzyme A